MAKNDFLPFATSDGANVLTADEYQKLTSRSNGFSAGVARSQEFNTVWRQSSVMAHVIAQFIADTNNSDVADDGDLDKLQEKLIQALSKNVNNTVPTASLKTAGITRLSSATDSDSETVAATPKAVKAAMDLAASSAVKSVNGKKGEVKLTADDVGALPQTGGTVNGDVIVEDGQLSLKGDNRKQLGFYNQDGRVRMWLYKDKGGDGVRLNNGNDGGGEWVFHKNGNFYAPSGIVAGGNVTVSRSGRTAIYHENGDIEGQIWGGGSLSSWLNNQLKNRTRTTGGRGGWWYKDESTGFVFQGGVVSRSGNNNIVTFPVGYQRECFGVQMTLSAWRQSSSNNIFATTIGNSGFTAVMYEQEVEANWWAVGV